MLYRMDIPGRCFVQHITISLVFLCYVFNNIYAGLIIKNGYKVRTLAYNDGGSHHMTR